MKMNSIKGWLGLIFAATLLFSGCKKDSNGGPNIPNPDPGPGTVAIETQWRNVFAQLLMTDIYLWNKEAAEKILVQGLDYATEEDPIAFYDKMAYSADKWSEMTGDLKSFKAQFSGTETTFGYLLRFGRFTGTNTVFAVVAYVYPNTPADVAGIKRGDIIVGFNGQSIVMNDPENPGVESDNWRDLYYLPSISLEMGVHNVENDSVGPDGRTLSLTAREMYEDPIQYYTVLEEHGKKIGYLCYTNYILDPFNDAHGKLLGVFSEFKSAGVDDVVLDLRYNGGGYALTSVLLSNILAPKSALDAQKVMTVEQWNMTYDPHFGGSTHFSNQIKYEYEGKTYADQIVNMDLSRVYVLTSGNTASASESTIVGLKPYMDVILVGSPTSGKFCGGIIFDRESYSGTENISALENWGAYTMVYQFTNVNNDRFPNGFAPEIENTVSEDLMNAYPFGDTRDPLLGRALELITGQTYLSPEVRSGGGSAYPMIPAEHVSVNRFDGKLIDLRKPELSGENL